LIKPYINVGLRIHAAIWLQRKAKMKEWIAVLRAADAAARWHVHQRRKGAAEEPYINHLLEVASLVAEATEGRNPRAVIAALLHDAIEDQEVPRELIAREFGEDVAALVEEVSDDKGLQKHHRKRIQVETAHNKSDDAKLIKLADKTSNLRAITVSAPPDWSVKRRLEYIRWAKEVVSGLRGASPLLEQRFDRAAEEAERSVHVPAGSM
jgi:GTP diphosphokinase / guanosine-3',5'-bis(diphosphate) 3'-diphosphatase